MLRDLFSLCVEAGLKLHHAIIDAAKVVMKLIDIDGFCVGEGVLLERVRISAS